MSPPSARRCPIKTGPRTTLLIRGDALNALTSLDALPEFAAELVGKVRLAYLDPPFHTQQSFLHYDEAHDYHPDFAVVERDETHWIVEVKMNTEMSSEEVQSKREAARRWANHVTADPKVSARWRHLLLSETNVETAKGSWTALKKLGA